MLQQAVMPRQSPETKVRVSEEEYGVFIDPHLSIAGWTGCVYPNRALIQGLYRP